MSKKNFYTIGMAGHIDHGKTALTQALTAIDTDRLDAEKKRQVSIEPGFAPLTLADDKQATIIDMPGHEKFIRQMIAGAAGIDLVVIVIAADEGIMPQTKEHMQILSFLDRHEAVIALTKADIVSSEWLDMVKEDIQQQLAETSFSQAAIYTVDSLSHQGLKTFRQYIQSQLQTLPAKSSQGPFRLPIDQVFTIKGIGTIVRGTVLSGTYELASPLKIMPQNKAIRSRSLQVQHKSVEQIHAGQRAAMNVADIDKKDIRRGDVLLTSEQTAATRRIDVFLQSIHNLATTLKQRAPVTLHVGTAIVQGMLILFDRKVLQKHETVLAQIQLEEDIVVERGDRYIIRRPSPAETVAGGWVIDPYADKHRQGAATIEQLVAKKDLSAEERIINTLRTHIALPPNELMIKASMTETDYQKTSHLLEQRQVIRLLHRQYVVLEEAIKAEEEHICDKLRQYHEDYPLRQGMETITYTNQRNVSTVIVDAALNDLQQREVIKPSGSFIALKHFQPQPPQSQADKLKALIKHLESQQLEPDKWQELLQQQRIPETLQDDVTHYMLQQKLAYTLDEQRFISSQAVHQAARHLYDATKGEAFSLQVAKQTLALSRKNIIPFLELLDEWAYTKRVDQERQWLV